MGPSLRDRVVPRNLQDPFGLAMRLLRTRDRAAYFAMGTAALGALAAPLDALLARREARLYAAVTAPRRPVLIVAGAPRSGTTLLLQTLAHHLPLQTINNLTSVFPRAPVLTSRLCARWLRPRPTYDNFYGRTAGFAQPNDALYLWDRWLGTNRYVVPSQLSAEAAEAMRRFFAAWEQAFGRPVINKNNALATCLELIAGALPTAHFLVAEREAAYNVQSILAARRLIQGDVHRPYGVGDPDWRPPADAPPDPVADVCAQVLYHQRRAREQQQVLGSARLWIVPYEELCRAPHEIVARVGREVLGLDLDAEALRHRLPAFRHRDTVRDRDEFARITETLARLRPAAPASSTAPA